MNRLLNLWADLRASFWFVPAAIVAGMGGLAVLMIQLSVGVSSEWLGQHPWLFGSGAEGARGVLQTIASSMITVAGVIFSITIVTLSLASSQYTPRILRSFMSDRTSQIVLGTFVGIYTYCLIVLRTIRSGDEGAFVPALAVLGSLVLALVGIGLLIVFIHHTAVSIQATSILNRICEETHDALDRLFPAPAGDGPPDDVSRPVVPPAGPWHPVPSPDSGYLQLVDADGLIGWAEEHDVVLRMAVGVGSFIVAGSPLIEVCGPKPSPEQADELTGHYVIRRTRTVEQDPGFGVRQMVDIALKALSPGVNDTTTALQSIEQLTVVLSQLAERPTPAPARFCGERLRLMALGPDFARLMSEAFSQIRQNAEGNVAVLHRLGCSCATIGARTARPDRRETLGDHVDRLLEVARRTVPGPQDLAELETFLTTVRRELERFPTPVTPDPIPA